MRGYTYYNPGGAAGMRDRYYSVINLNDPFNKPNPYGMAAIRNAKDTITESRVSIEHLADYLDQLAARLENDEDRYIQKKIAQFEKDPYFKGEIEGETNGVGMLRAIKDAQKKGNYSDAFTLLFNARQSLQTLMNQRNASIRTFKKNAKNLQGIQKTTEWRENVDLVKLMNDDKLFEELENSFEQSFDINDPKLSPKFTNEYYIGIAEKMEEAIRNEQFRRGNYANLDPVFKRKGGITDQIKDIFAQAGLIRMTNSERELLKDINHKESNADKLRDSKINAILKKAVLQNTDMKKRNKKQSTLLKEILDVINSGDPTELFGSLKLQKDMGVIGVALTGSQRGKRTNWLGESFTVQRREDVVAFDITTDYDKVVEKVRDYFYNTYDWATMSTEQMEKLIQETAQKWVEEGRALEDFFTIRINTKGYTSNLDLAILNKGTKLKAAETNLINLSQSLKSVQGNVDKITGSSASNFIGKAKSIDNLIFLLDSAIPIGMSSDILSSIEDCIASMCWIWMWDANMTDLVNLGDNSSNSNTLYLFQSGGALFSGSQIIKEASKEIKGTSMGGIIKVHLSMTKDVNREYYLSLKEKFPVPAITKGESYTYIDSKGREKTSNKHYGSYEDQQKALEKRWVMLRNKVINDSTLHIDFNQRMMDSLLMKLSVLRNL